MPTDAIVTSHDSPDGLEDEAGDDPSTIYSYHSTWSLNYIMIACREKAPRKLAERAAAKRHEEAARLTETRAIAISMDETVEERVASERATSYAEAVAMLHEFALIDRVLKSKAKGLEEHENAWEFFCHNVSTIQAKAFNSIILDSFEPNVRSAFRRVFERRNEIGDAVVSSWRLPGVEYTVYWLF
ncbi:hypothetical protein SCHPADRAFT_998645 [Schizopora paradoxa]|uniref:Uncharacterized protein n=1 Tax=Schizopora paradoxa TaxID=27342 RepID=A0A0H2RQG6_9AGAM|nr:hypothetical protein SCHPADRAFT_998645 [Schizopora paradoxa]